MRRRSLVAFAVIILVASPVFSDWRFDLGLDVAFGGGVFSDGDSATGGFDGGVLPIPIAQAAYQFDVGPVGVGAGIRGLPLIAVMPFWPDAFVEFELGPVALEGHLGGLVFGYVGIGGGGLEAGEVFIPEISGWFKLGKRFRLGGGGIGLWVPNVELIDDEGLSVWLFFVGAKWVLTK